MNALPSLAAVGTALPPNYVAQEELTSALREVWARNHSDSGRFDRIQAALGITGRHIALPMRDYYALDSLAKCNDAWLRVAPDLAEATTRDALSRAGLAPDDVDHVFFVTVTGIATPSIEVRLANRLGMRRDVKRTPIFGLGCVAGASGLARASDYLRGFPEHVALLVSVELCSLTLQREDLSVANIIASGLFGDGAAAAVIVGAARSAADAPRIIATRAILYPDSERALGWDLVESGFKIVLSAGLPQIVSASMQSDVDSFLADNRLGRRDISHWIAHPGGPKILQVLEESMQLPTCALERSWRIFRSLGNMSSASVLFTLRDLIDAQEARPGDYGLIVAMGPGFSVELVLLRWP